MRTVLVLLAAVAQTVFVSISEAQTIRARQGRDLDSRTISGTFDVRVYVDGQVDLKVRGAEIDSEVFTGRPIRDAGSEYSAPMPRTEFTRFQVDRVDGRGRVELLEEPSRRNGYTARIRVEDSKGGEDRYHIRISWETNQSFPQRANPRDPRFSTYRPRRGFYSLPGARLSSNANYPSGYDNALDGRLEFRGRVDDEVILYVRRDEISSETIRGRNVQVESFRFSQPLPDRVLRGFSMNQRDGRGAVELLEEPSRENGWTAVIRILDDKSGDDRYHFDLNWRR
jgi:hypothetical protein